MHFCFFFSIFVHCTTLQLPKNCPPIGLKKKTLKAKRFVLASASALNSSYLFYFYFAFFLIVFFYSWIPNESSNYCLVIVVDGASHTEHTILLYCVCVYRRDCVFR